MWRIPPSINVQHARLLTAETARLALLHVSHVLLVTFCSPTQQSLVAFYHVLTSTQPPKFTFPLHPTPQTASVVTPNSPTVSIVSTRQLQLRLFVWHVLLDFTYYKMAHVPALAQMDFISLKESSVCHVDLIVVCVQVTLCVKHARAVTVYT